MHDIKDAIAHLRKAHKHTSGLKWQKGLTTHHTVTETGYRVAEFHHADDAHFCDAAHELVPLLCAELERAVDALGTPAPSDVQIIELARKAIGAEPEAQGKLIEITLSREALIAFGHELLNTYGVNLPDGSRDAQR